MTPTARASLISAALLALFGLAFNACCDQKLVDVPDDDAGSLQIGDDPDAGLVPPKKDAGVDAGEHVDAGERDAGEKDGGPKDAGEDAGQSSTSSGGSTTGAASSSGGSGGSGNSGSGGGTTGGNAGGSGNGGSGGGTSNGGGGSGGSGSGGACVQDPDLTYPSWAMSADYQMTVAVNNGGLPSVISAFVGINNFLIALAAFGVPVPAWATTLFGNLANLQQLFQDINVQSNLALTPGGNSMTYNAQETWQQVSVMQNGAWVTLNSNVGFTSPPAYTVTTCSGTATFSSHDLGGAIGSLIPSVIDAIVNISTCANGTCYASLDDAVNAALDCNQYSSSLSAYLFCTGESVGLETALTNALNGISFGVGVCTVEGTATIQPGNPLALINGVWTGQLSGVPFPGTFSAVE